MSIQGKIYTSFVIALNKLARSIIKPDKQYANIEEIDLDEVKRLKKQYGIGGIILDVDGTIMEELEFITDKTKRCLDFLKREFKIYIVSNNKSEEIARIANKLGINYLPFAMKPKRKPFLKASEEMGLEPQNVIVIGDGFLTDILGGSRSGMFTAAITHEKQEDIER